MEGNRSRQKPVDQRETTFIDLKESAPKDATQRIYVDSQQSPARRTSAAQPPRTGAQPQRKAPASSQKPPVKKKKKTNTVTIVILCLIALVLLAASIAVLAITFAEPEDDGLILNNVYVAGVNLGGKSPESAKQILLEETVNTFSKLDMVVEVHDTLIRLSPDKTGASLDIEAAVQAAYNYGRTGTRAENQLAKDKSLTSSYTISIIPYLNLDTDYIQDQVDELGYLYSSVLSQPSYKVEGERPDLNMDRSEINTDIVYQTLTITLGTAEYGLDVDYIVAEGYKHDFDMWEDYIRIVLDKILPLKRKSEL